MAQTAKEQFERLVTKLDNLELGTLIIFMESVKAGESRKTAIEKAASFLGSHPGREKQAFDMLNAYLNYIVTHA